MNQPKHREEPNAQTLEFWRMEENLHRIHGIKPAILPGFGIHRKPSIMASETEARAA